MSRLPTQSAKEEETSSRALRAAQSMGMSPNFRILTNDSLSEKSHVMAEPLEGFRRFENGKGITVTIFQTSLTPP